jgi:hypothetical protein
MKLNRTLVIGGITGGIILIISSYLMFRGDTNETNTDSSPNIMENIGKNDKGDYLKDKNGIIGPLFGGNKKRNTKKRNTKKNNKTMNKKNKK